MYDKYFQKNVETRLDIWDHLATIFFIQLYTGTLCILCMEEDFQYFETIYVYILNILRLHRIKISNLVHFFWPRLSWVLWEGSYTSKYILVIILLTIKDSSKYPLDTYIIVMSMYYLASCKAHSCFISSSHNNS